MVFPNLCKVGFAVISILIFSLVLGSSMKLGFPLPASLPSTDRARDRLLAKLFEYRKQIRGTEGEVDEDFALIYAYGIHQKLHALV
jgi:hypothetical protein